MSWNHRILAHENNGEVYFQNSTEGGMSSNVEAFMSGGHRCNSLSTASRPPACTNAVLAAV